MARIEFDIHCEMEERWVNDFMSFLKYMQSCGSAGHSCRVGFYADGDGDFRPRFSTDIDFEKVDPCWTEKKEKEYIKKWGLSDTYFTSEVTYDAG